MWFFDFIPEVLFYLLFLAGLVGLLVSLLVPLALLKTKVKYASIAILVLAIYLLGMLKVNNHWKERASKLQEQVAVLQAQSQETNTKVETRLVTRTQTVRLQAQEIVKYVDRESTKINETCKVPQEFVQAHNQSAQPPK